MKVFNKKSSEKHQISREQALQSIPVKNIQISEEITESGEVMVYYLTTMRPWISKVVRRLGKAEAPPQTKKLQLDAMGTQVWDMIDGKRTVKEIVRRFAEFHRLHRKEAEMSVTAFLHELGKRGIIGMK